MKNTDPSAGGEAQPEVSSPSKEFISRILARYKTEAGKLRANQLLQLSCSFDGIEVFPDMLGTFYEDTIQVGVYQRARDGSITKKTNWFVPIPKLSFRMSVVPKTAHKPPKEIGFHTGKEQ